MQYCIFDESSRSFAEHVLRDYPKPRLVITQATLWKMISDKLSQWEVSY